MTPRLQSFQDPTSDASGHAQPRNSSSMFSGISSALSGIGSALSTGKAAIKKRLVRRDEDLNPAHPGAFSHTGEPTYIEGATVYLDGSILSRPLSMPILQRLFAAVFVIIALMIGYTLADRLINDVVYASAKIEAEIQEILAQEVSYDLPNLMSLAALSDSDIVTTLADSGYTLYDANTDDEEASGLSLFKFPSNMDFEEASAYYQQGVSSLSSSEAISLLYGMWQLTTDRTSGVNIRVRYADFTSGSVEEAVQNAMVEQGLDQTELGDFGVDDHGNTYQAGTVTIDGTTYSWQVSACLLSAVYDIDFLPETACYVGVRLYY